MQPVLAFDVYGTLVDTSGVAARLEPLVGDEAARFARLWREKQLEYSFRRALMQRYAPFGVCVREALEYTCAALDLPLDEPSRLSLLDAFARLPLFDDVERSLETLAGAGCTLYAFSNGTREAVESLLRSAGIGGRFIDIVSVDEIGTFKPSPAVYRHFLSRAGTSGDDAWLVSGNSFDVIGAISAGMNGVWVRRDAAAVFDPWGIEPPMTVANLGELAAAFAARA